MRPTHALAFAVLFGALAVGMVAADMAFNVVLTVEARQADGAWATASQSGGGTGRYPEAFSGCTGRAFRVTVTNDRPVKLEKFVHIGYTDAKGIDHLVVQGERWPLASGDSRSHEFEVPDVAFEGPSLETGKPVRAGVQVFAFLEERYGPEMVSAYCQEPA